MNTRILIIDNEPRWIEFAENDLKGCDIVVAHNIDTALNELEKDKFNLVIASSGYLEVLESVSERIKDKQVMVTTVKPNTQEALDAYRKGADRYITKSFQKENLYNDVRKLVPASSAQ